MVRHTVLFKLKNGATDSEVKLAFLELLKLKTRLPGFLRAAYGKCTFHNANHDGERLYGFSIDFENDDAYGEFLNNSIADHAKGCLLNIIDGGIEGLYCYDMGKLAGIAYGPNPLEKHRRPVPRLVPRGF